MAKNPSQPDPAGLWRLSSVRPGVSVARPGSSLPAAVHGPEEYSCTGAQEREVAEHLDDEHDPGGLGFGGDVAETHRRKTVTLKYRASVRVSGWVKLAAEARSIKKYVEANSSR